MTKRTISPREAAARALCRKDGHPENIQFEGRPMWESYLDTVDVVLETATPLSIEATALRMTELVLEEHRKSMIHFDASKAWIFETYQQCLAKVRKQP
jgi:hypothetical protein